MPNSYEQIGLLFYKHNKEQKPKKGLLKKKTPKNVVWENKDPMPYMK